MKIGVSEVDITPQPGVELSGFAARMQPSTGIIDRLFARAICIEDHAKRLLWLHCDLIGLDRTIVNSFRNWARQAHRFAPEEVMVSATHTHSGPCTIRLREAGTYDPDYVRWLQMRLRKACATAMARLQTAELVFAESRLGLAVDRRNKASPHTDPRVMAIGFRRPNGRFLAAILNFGVHPVALGSGNRRISGDLLGIAASRMSSQLPGRPVVLSTNGACGNLNPPAENVSVKQMRAWSCQVADSVGPLLSRADGKSEESLALLRISVKLPLEVLDVAGIRARARRALEDPKSLSEWGDKFKRVVRHWERSLLRRPGATHHDAEIFGIRIGPAILLGINAEVFSEFTDMVRQRSGVDRCFIIGYANGDIGYLPTRAAYAEGGYEVDVAHFFYGGFRPGKGSLEILAREAANLARKIQKL